MTRPDGDLRIDAVLRNTYRIVSLLGRGGMGSVYLAQHLRLPGKQVAVKVLRGGDHLTQEILTRFRREAEIASRLGHPNIVEVLDYDTLEDGNPFLVLEFLRGESLATRLERGRLPLDQVFSFTRQMGSALQAAHGAGIVHRDLKPANVHLVPTDSGGIVTERVKLLDFGISKVLSSETLQTQEATIIGTPQYMSPEQAMGKNREIDARTDIFALGCIVYEMMAGKPVFGAGGLAQMIFRVVYEPAEPLGPLCPEAPAHAVSAVMKALSKSPDERYPDVASFVLDLTGSPLHTLSPAAAQPVPKVGPRPPSGIALPSSNAADVGSEGFDATIAPGSVKSSGSGTGVMGQVQPDVGFAGTGRMGLVQPEAPPSPAGFANTGRLPAPSIDPPGLEPTLISKQVPSVPAPERPPQPATALTPPVSAAPQPTPASGPLPAVAQVQPAPPPSSNRGLMVAAALALFGAGGGVVWWMNRPETPPTAPAAVTPQATAQQPQPAPSPPQAAAQPQTVPGTPTTTAQANNDTQPPPTQQAQTVVPTVATVTSDKPATTTQRPSSRPEPREELPEQVVQMLKEGESALAAGNATRAIELARSSQRTQKSKAAYSLLTRAYCQQKDLGGAKSEWPKVGRADQSRVKKFCMKHDIEL
ncbi:serine/threonine-protein kinase [Pyxidicoccus xibeiensis]|uniref:serine/threonine-protein kinase n=1 Tax=Pyxidicoccus xibeiensis TaxID=2906759 RepID=UPI0020A714D7|nr:serine/threonine protein kinase [Pyxidicoccus xibeiensis]MCP3141480.1 protein kinase [Pyxidicoccus xibeiensis]